MPLAPNLPPLPFRFRKLPIDERGFPVPMFVQWVEGRPDFRVIKPGWMSRCHHGRLCWLCGEPLGKHLAFVIGPMCAINRVTSEPPSHLGCAEFAVRACPFLAFPNRKRDKHTPIAGDHRSPAGVHLDRNPGACAIWVTDGYKPFKAEGGTLFRLDAPEAVHWYAHGRKATRAEIVASIDSGMPHLREIAELQGRDAMKALDQQYADAQRLLPEAAA